MTGIVTVSLVAAVVSVACSLAAVVLAVRSHRLQRDLERRREALRRGPCAALFFSRHLGRTLPCGRPFGHDGEHGVMKPGRPPRGASGVSLGVDGRSR